MSKPIAVLAGSHREFWRLLNDTHLEEFKDAVFIRGIDDIRAREFSHVIRYGTWYEDQKSHELYDILKARIR